MRAVVIRAVVLLLSTAVCLVVVEQVLRLAGFHYRPMSIDVADRNDARLFHLFEDEHFVYDPDLIWRPRKEYGVFNRQGFRGPLLTPEKPPGEIRIVALGDSNTLGWAGEEGPNWPGDLALLLEAVDERVELVNGGVWGYTSYQGLLRLREALAFSPDLVLLSFGSNDAHLVGRSDREFAAASLLGQSSLRWLLRYRTAQLASAAWDRLDAGTSQPRHRVDPEEYRENLRRMAAEVRQAGAVPVFLTRPYIGPLKNDGRWKEFGHLYNLATVEVAAEADVPVIDFYSIFRDQIGLFSDESHFTREGHALAAAIAARHLRPILASTTSFGARPGRRTRPSAASPQPR